MKCFGLVACTLALAAPASGALTANADMTYTQLDASTYRYSISLHNTGDTTVGTLWYSWIPGYDFMPGAPFNIQSPVGWVGSSVAGFPGYSLEWYAQSGLVPGGQSLDGFRFDSTVTPAQMLQMDSLFHFYHLTHSFVYTGLPLSDPGFAFDVRLVPEPGSLAIIAAGVFMLVRRRSPNN